MTRLVQISAWNDSGGGYLHRLLDGHPALASWPFELLLGQDDKAVDAFGEDWFRGRYRWPRLGDVTQLSADGLFDSLSDHELKSVLRGVPGAKHGEFRVPVDIDAWRSLVGARWQAAEQRDQTSFLRIYIESFVTLRGQEGRSSGMVVGHCPCAILDAEEMWRDLPDARIVHVIRRPENGFADMRRRHPSLSPLRYATKWTMINAQAAILAGKHPDRVRLVILDELLADPETVLCKLCSWLGIGFDPIILRPTWGGRDLGEKDMQLFGGAGLPDLARERARPDIDPVDLDTITTQCAGTRTLVDVVRRALSPETEASAQ